MTQPPVAALRFSAEVLAGGRGGYAVVVPPAVVDALSSGRAAVRVRVDGGPAATTRLATYRGRTYLGLRLTLLRERGVTAGDVVELELTEEPVPAAPAPAEAGPPGELLAALAGDPPARAAWEALTEDQRAEYVRWVAGAADPGTRGERLSRTLRRLHRG